MAGGYQPPGAPLPGLPWETKPPGEWLSWIDPDDFTKRRLEKAEKAEIERNKILDREDELELEEYLSDERKNRAAEADRRRARFGLVDKDRRPISSFDRLGRGLSTLGRFGALYAPAAIGASLFSDDVAAASAGSPYDRATGPEMFDLPHTTTPTYGPVAHRSFPADPALALDRSLSTEAAREEFAKSLRSWEERPMIATDPSTDPKYDPTPEIDPETGAVLTYSLDKSRLVGDISTAAGRAYEATQPQPVDYTFGTDTGVNTTGFSMGQYGVDAQGVMVPTMTSALQQSINVGASDPNAPAGPTDIDASPTGWKAGQALVDRFGNPVTLSNDPQSVAAANYRSFLADKDITVANTIKEALARADEAIAGMGLTGAAKDKASALASAELGYLSASQLQGLQAAQQEQEQAVAQAAAAAAYAASQASADDVESQVDTFSSIGTSKAKGKSKGKAKGKSKGKSRAAIIDALVSAVGPGESALSATYAGLGYGGGLGEGAEGLGEGYGGFGGGWT